MLSWLNVLISNVCYGTMSNIIHLYLYEWQAYKSNAQDLSDSRLINFVIISMSVVRCIIGASKSNTHMNEKFNELSLQIICYTRITHDPRLLCI